MPYPTPRLTPSPAPTAPTDSEASSQLSTTDDDGSSTVHLESAEDGSVSSGSDSDVEIAFYSDDDSDRITEIGLGYPPNRVPGWTMKDHHCLSLRSKLYLLYIFHSNVQVSLTSLTERRDPSVKQLPCIMNYAEYRKLRKTYKRPGREILSPKVKEELRKQRDAAVEAKRAQ